MIHDCRLLGNLDVRHSDIEAQIYRALRYKITVLPARAACVCRFGQAVRAVCAACPNRQNAAQTARPDKMVYSYCYNEHSVPWRVQGVDLTLLAGFTSRFYARSSQNEYSYKFLQRLHSHPMTEKKSGKARKHLKRGVLLKEFRQKI